MRYLSKLPDFRSLPSVDKLARSPRLAGHSERVRNTAARGAIAQARAALAKGKSIDFESRAVQLALELSQASLRPAINMSGVVLHTGLGRARLADAAVESVKAVASGHSSLEFDEVSGGRGDRQDHVRTLLRELTGCGDAHVVNNCAAAVVLALRAVASGREVVLSRGQMVEIGGSFRMPEIVAESGCKLVEVGTTNKTRLEDYAAAVGPQSGAVLRCHPSNFKIVGFHEEPTAQELAAFCKERSLSLIDDVGSGCITDTTTYGLPNERTLREALSDGADIVTASGDKLLGGPQCGLILGTPMAVAAIRRHPLSRAVRIDKLTLAALEATLRLYLQGRELEIPVWRYLARPPAEVRQSAERIAKALGDRARVESGSTEVGGGSLPGASVPSYRVTIQGANPEDLAAALRARTTPIVGYISDGQFWLDPRTAEDGEVDSVIAALAEL